jgi:hypothetical protein
MRQSSERRPRTRRLTRGAAGAALLAVLLLAVTAGSVWAAFTAKAGSNGDEIRAAADWVAPTAGASVIQKTEGGTPGYIRQGGTYRVYASVTDAGNPASGTSSVTGNVSTVTTSQTAASLSAGSFTVGGLGYNRQSSSVTANASLAAGTYGYSLTAVDIAANSRTQSDYSVIVDNTAPNGADVQTANKAGGTAGHPEQGDSITLTFSEPIDPNSVLGGWTGSTTNVVVNLDHTVPAFGNNDTVTVYNAANTTLLPLGTVNLGRAGYAPANADVAFGESGTASTMTESGNAITITLGTPSETAGTVSSSGTMIWSPAGGATDRAGNHEGAGTRSESGTADKEF